MSLQMLCVTCMLLIATAALGALPAAAVRAAHPDQVLELPDYGQLLSNNYAGYISVPGGRKAFYWFVESESSPSTDPLMLFLNGGPGCSSLLGFMEENGVYTMRHGGNFVLNEYRWTTNANMLWIESPPGVGFSQDTVPPIQWNDDNTAQFNYDALKGFFAKFPQFRANKLFLSGESYAGHYVPQLANLIHTGDDAGMKASMRGFMVGNPCTGDIGCNNPDPTLHPYMQYHGFAPLNDSIPTARNANYDPYDILVPTCDSSQVAKRVRWSHPVVDALKKRLANPPAPYGPCADEFVTAWINRADVKKAIHAPLNVTWAECSNTLNYKFNFKGVTDLYEKFFQETSWAIMIFSGTSDTVVNFVQTQTVVNGFRRPLKNPRYSPWNYPDVYNPNATQLGGFYLEFDRLSFATVNAAGHMVPQFQPPRAKELFTSFLTIGRPGRM